MSLVPELIGVRLKVQQYELREEARGKEITEEATRIKEISCLKAKITFTTIQPTQ